MLIIASLETKHEEVNDLVDRIGRHGFQCEIIDTSLRSGGVQLDGKGKIAAMHACAQSANASIRRAMAGGAQVVVGIGGGTGAQIIAEAISDLPFAMPKILINTMAHDMRPDTADNSVIIIPSVSDLAGMNPTLRQVFENAAAVVAGLARAATFHPHISTSPTIGMTTLGTTSRGADLAKAMLQEAGHEVTAFHANGYGGKAFTRWCACGAFSGVMDFTTHEVTRVLFDRACNVPSDRYQAAAKSNLPQVVLPGGVNFMSRGPLDHLSDEQRTLPHYTHSYSFTHIGLTPDQMAQCADYLAEHLTALPTPTIMIVPMGGFSTEDRSGGAIENRAGREAFARIMESQASSGFEVRRVETHICEAETAEAAVSAMTELLGRTSNRPRPADAHTHDRARHMTASR